MRYAILNGDGAGRRPRSHFQTLVQTTDRIEAMVLAGRLVAGKVAARSLTAIERGVVATRMLRDGFRAEQVLSVLT
ncbi:hypothetical protein [Aromatoleum evansii]|uniref:hypothetical protein n=1 Tax=Aromatoleum evansii TaxID=59406 RepID=UPI00145C5F5C|nr:hypothetical protein [Aromatoleum evansii]NMG31471.1 hypothetical protein [Aromatoleum evansii]